MSKYPEQIRSGIVLSTENLARHVEDLERVEAAARELVRRDLESATLASREQDLISALAHARMFAETPESS